MFNPVQIAEFYQEKRFPSALSLTVKPFPGSHLCTDVNSNFPHCRPGQPWSCAGPGAPQAVLIPVFSPGDRQPLLHVYSSSAIASPHCFTSGPSAVPAPEPFRCASNRIDVRFYSAFIGVWSTQVFKIPGLPLPGEKLNGRFTDTALNLY